MVVTFLRSNNIYLRSLSPSDDLTDYLKWLNDQEITRYMGSGKFPINIDSLKEYLIQINSSSNDFHLGIFLNKDNKHIGNLTVENIDWINRKGEIGIVIGDKEQHQKGYAREAINISLKHCFDKLNLNRITSGMVSLNEPSKKLFEKCGFALEGTLKEDYFLEGVYHDTYRYAILKNSFENKNSR